MSWSARRGSFRVGGCEPRFGVTGRGPGEHSLTLLTDGPNGTLLEKGHNLVLFCGRSPLQPDLQFGGMSDGEEAAGQVGFVKLDDNNPIGTQLPADPEWATATLTSPAPSSSPTTTASGK